MDWLINLLAGAGVALIAYGLWLIYPPLALIALGGALLAVAVAMTRVNEYRKRTPR